MIRRAIASAFANIDTRRVRATFSMASGYPYHFVEGQVNSVSTNTITDSTIANQHSTTTDGLASANIDSFPTAGVRTGMVLHKLSGEDGIMEEFGYISKTEDNSLTATLTNSATFSTNDYYRTYIPLRAGHSVQIKNLAINSSPFSHVVTDIKYTEGEKGFMTEINTVGDVANPKASTAGPRIKPATPPIVYDDETYNEGVPLGLQLANFSGTFSAGNTSGGNKNTAISYSAGTLEVNGETFDIYYETFSLMIKINEKEYYIGDLDERNYAIKHINRLLQEPMATPGTEGEEEDAEETPPSPPSSPTPPPPTPPAGATPEPPLVSPVCPEPPPPEPVPFALPLPLPLQPFTPPAPPPPPLEVMDEKTLSLPLAP